MSPLYTHELTGKNLEQALAQSEYHPSGSYCRTRQWHPLQHSCLENPMDGGAWWAAVYGVAQSRTRLKQLSSSSREGKWHRPDTSSPRKLGVNSKQE